MGALFGVSQAAYSKWENDKAEPEYETLIAICHKFSVSADWILGLDNNRQKTASVTATGHVVAANHSTVTTAPQAPAESARLLTIIESQQRVIENLSRTLPPAQKK